MPPGVASASDDLKRAVAILDAVGYASERLLKASQENVLPDVLARLGEATGVSRVYVFENGRRPDGALTMNQRAEWAGRGVRAEIDNPVLQDLPYEPGFERVRELLSRDDCYCGHVREFPASERAILEPQGIRSIAIVPIDVERSWWGFIGFDECAREREWSTAEMEALRTAARLLGAAIQRRRTDERDRAQAVTRGLVRRMLQGMGREGLVGTKAMRDLGRTLARELHGRDLEAHLRAFEGMGLGELRFAKNEGGRYTFEGGDMLEYAGNARAPTCHLPLGFLEGAVASVSGGDALGSEIACQSMGAAQCSFVVMEKPTKSPKA